MTSSKTRKLTSLFGKFLLYGFIVILLAAAREIMMADLVAGIPLNHILVYWWFASTCLC